MAFRVVDVGFPELKNPADYVRLARDAERLGFNGIWLQEGSGWGALPIAALILAGTERLTVGTGIVSPFKRHPESLAGDAAVLSEASGGRFILGLGSASPMLESFNMPIPQVAGMREAIDIVRRLLAGERFTHEGRVFTFRTPRPLAARPSHSTPIVLGAMGPKMIRLAAEVADGLLISRRGGSSPRYVRSVLDGVAAVDGRRPGFQVRCFFETAVDTDRKAALETMRSVFTGYTLPHLHRGVLETTEVAWSEVEPLAAAVRRGDPDVGARIPESVLDRLSVVGTPEECLRKLTAFRGLAIDVPILYLHGRDPARSLALAADMLPALREFQ